MPNPGIPAELRAVRGKPVVISAPAPNLLPHVLRTPELSLLAGSEAPVTLSLNVASDNHPLKLSNGGKLEWVGCGQAESLSKNAAYVLFDRGSYYECQPVVSFYEFIPATEHKVGEEEIDVINKRLKINKAKELAAQRRIAATMEQTNSDDDADTKRRKRPLDQLEYDDEEDDEEMLRMQKLPMNDRRVKKVLAKKKRARDLDANAQAKSSTALGELRKAEVDWDFEEGNATDDEEGAALSSEEVEDKAASEDIDEDSEDEAKMLTNYGETLNKMLQTQKRAQADQELQEYSDDDDDEDEEEGGSHVARHQQSKPRPAPSSLVPATSQVQTEERVREDLLTLLRTKTNVTIKMVLVELGVSARNAKFQLIKNLITEMCDIVTATSDNGEQVRYIKLKESLVK